LLPQRQQCSACGSRLWHLYQTQRTVTTLADVCRLTLTVLRCPNPACAHYHHPVRPEEEGAWALPHGEFGLDGIAHSSALRYRQHRSIPEIHPALQAQHVAIAPRTVTYLLERYEELLALRLADHARLKGCLTQQGHVILAIDGLQPFKTQDVLWVLRDTLSGEVLLARSLERARQEELADLLREVKQALPVPIQAVVSDAQRPIRLAVQQVLPTIPHQLCQFHYLKEAATPIVEADRHAKTELKKYTCGVREIERSMSTREDQAAKTMRGYCLAVRSALADDGKPPLQLPGLTMHERLSAIQASLERVAQKRGSRTSWCDYMRWWREACLPPSGSGHHFKRPRASWCEPPRCSPTSRRSMRRRCKHAIVCCSTRCSRQKVTRPWQRGRRHSIR
jgi:hypothetical protein